ncbi:cytochrome B [Brevirhabdus pacifica]|uniref:Cytochrome B n=2 Tax=Brevirhabdus pacifica TaxID=1267768 RepID=A0A1U7DMA5_9RHOB|nr:cytochrome B [Brevirhabdus pacifica]OWU78900.1 cytochrome B561 [Loktanella sp. 22II-4b]
MILGPGVLLSACDGPQSALSATGADAIAMEGLFWVMLIGATLIWILINGLIYYVTRVYTGSLSPRLAHGLIVGGGIIFPLVVVTSLLVYGLSAMPEQRAMGDGVKLRITGEQWWWRVEYWPEGADPANPPVAVSANEIRLPAGSRAEIELTAAKVIHSFWIPALGGKLDMFPGRVTRMSLKPLSVGVYRGQCAEFCGQSHALMALNAVVMEPGDFDAWLKAEAQDAAPPKGYAATRGAEIFAQQGCGACHAVRGTPARGGVGPDLTHLGGRTSLAAGILPMDREALMKWILSPASLKPGARMPGYDHLEREDLSALATYLEGLK